MRRKLSIIFIVCSVFVVGCKVTGPADDEWETRDDNTYNTGRLFSKDGSALTIYSNEEKDKDSALFHANKENKGQTSSSSSSSSSPASDYESYKQWSEAKQTDSAEYEKFKKWQEFEDYNRWKEQQKK